MLTPNQFSRNNSSFTMSDTTFSLMSTPLTRPTCPTTHSLLPSLMLVPDFPSSIPLLSARHLGPRVSVPADMLSHLPLQPPSAAVEIRLTRLTRCPVSSSDSLRTAWQARSTASCSFLASAGVLHQLRTEHARRATAWALSGRWRKMCLACTTGSHACAPPQHSSDRPRPRSGRSSKASFAWTALLAVLAWGCCLAALGRAGDASWPPRPLRRIGLCYAAPRAARRSPR